MIINMLSNKLRHDGAYLGNDPLKLLKKILHNL